MTQFNSPYPAAPVIADFLRSRGMRNVRQADLSLELALRLFCREGILKIERELKRRFKGLKRLPASVSFFLRNAALYADRVDAAVSYLQGRRPALAHRIAGRTFLPEGPRFDVLNELRQAGSYEAAVNSMKIQNQAQYYASLFIDDIADVIKTGVDARFELSRYAEKIALSAPKFTSIRNELKKKPTLVDRELDVLAQNIINSEKPGLVAITIPFPGNVYGAFRIAREVKRLNPSTPVAIGGGYVSTELRGLSEPAVFDYVDYVILDDGEAPLLRLVEHLEGRVPEHRLMRTFVRRGGRVLFMNTREKDIPFTETGMPSYKGLPLKKYIPLLEVPNPVMRLWSSGRWNKLMLAHGCYWHRCAFCDTSLDYIRRFESAPASLLADRIQNIVKETGLTEFHFTDEAAPAALLESLSKELLRKKLRISWWGNIRLEKSFTQGLANLMKAAGCLAVTAGLETACDRTLALMDKGVTVSQAVTALRNFARSGVLTHVYLIYGFPTQTPQEMIDALETVRRLFAAGYIQSAYWHRFALTAHSPMAVNPARFGIELLSYPKPSFALNEIPYRDLSGIDYDRFGPGLRAAVYNYMHGAHLSEPLSFWFNFRVPKPNYTL